ncbi:MAG: hypothetical protein H6825_03280 [Planctomycetes bacterium]|nr:hypothetical protein [Planctomycetota bacterium]
MRHLALLAAVLLFLLPTDARANGTVDTFTGASNPSGWTWGPPSQFPPGGGNPGSFLRSQPDTFAPQLHTTVAGSPFHGDWRAMQVSSVGVDLRTISTQFAFQRECTLILTSGSGCQVYFLGTDFVPQVAEGWKSFDFAVDAASTTLPAGWSVLNPCGSDDQTWNTVITDVTEVRFFYGDPTFFFIFDIWDVGADNPRLECGSPFTDLGHGLAGTNGVPTLTGTGTLAAGSPTTLALDGALGSSTTYFVLGASLLSAPFKGGVLVPSPDVVIPVPTSPSGELDLAFAWPVLAPGTTIAFQHWIADGAGPAGFAASNGLLATQP